ncbi:MAG: hypothetical protein SH820_09490 [Xanthomonadales bacterium]|nr:hypothetical protein [Xanthomonadales bacterium]
MNSATSTAEILTDAAWHLYALEPDSQSRFLASQWLYLSEAHFRAASFLDQRLLAPAAQQTAAQICTLPLSELQGLIDHQPHSLQPPQAHFIFHIGHCGSTLISRALAASPAVLPLREPLSLRQLAAGLAHQHDQSWWSQSLQLALAAHSRVFHPGQVSMIKATSTCNALIKPLMELAPQSKSLLLYLPLESYLAGMLGKQAPALDLQGHAAARLDEWRSLTGNPLNPAEGEEFTEAQLAILAWLTSMTRLLQARDQHPDRCLLLDFENFLADPATSLEHLIEFFSLAESSAEILEAWPNISVGYSKQPDQPYSAFNRSKTLMRGRMQRAADIRAGLDWSKDLIRQYPAFQACEGFL